jgi:predicted transposase/invertase (TIGR01784 family)
VPKIGSIDFSLDIFAESNDHRVIIEIQRIDYDYNFDRFLHYFIMAIAQLQKSSDEYKIHQTVYGIVVMTEPYKFDQKNGLAIRDEVLITSLDPRNLEDEVKHIYGHRLIFLNHHFRNEKTPVNYRDWLDLFYESIHNARKYKVNTGNPGIKRAVELIEYDHLTPKQMQKMKVEAQRKVVRQMDREEGKKEGLEEGKKEGLEEGKKEGLEEGKKEGARDNAHETARKMKTDGLPVDLISKYTGLAAADIEAL